MSKLVPMTQTEFDAFLEQEIPEYAADNVRAGYWAESESLQKSREAFERLLPQGLQSKDQYLYSIYEGDEAVGVIWMRAEMERPVKSGLIYDLRVDGKFRGKGYGKQGVYLIEDKARELGLKSIGLHVFGYNTVARNLYEGIGYETTSLNMIKQL